MSFESGRIERPGAEPQLPVLRFSLRYMFWWVTGVCVLFGVLAAVPIGLAVVALLLAVSVVVLHVSSTAIGMRLREHANDRRAWESRQQEFERPAVSAAPGAVLVSESVEPPRRSPLHGREQPLRRIRLCLTAGAILGGLFGVVALSVTIGDRTTVAGILVGAASMAVVGGWIAFVAASAWSIFRQGWKDAVAEDGQAEVARAERR